MVSCIDTDLYADLGLQPGADEDAIRQAFRRLAFELHPDRNPDPSAAEAFRRVRAAYETLLDPSYRAATEAERVAEEVLRAAAAAERFRPHPVQALRPVPFTLNVGGLRLRAAAATRVALGGSTAAVTAVGLAALTGFAVLLVVAAASFAAAAVAWLTRRHPVALLVYGDGFEDGRWPEAGRIGWADVYALDPDYASGTLDLLLSQPATDRLTARAGGPADALVWQGDRPFYRLRLGAQLREAVAAIEARAGVSAH